MGPPPPRCRDAKESGTGQKLVPGRQEKLIFPGAGNFRKGQMAEKETSGARGLLASIFKYSIATWANFLIYGASLLLAAWFVPADVYGPVDIFVSTSTLFMNICILGLDNSFIRFFNEPPRPLDKDGLFGACFGLSRIVLGITALILCVFFPGETLRIFFTDPLDNIYLALLFLNAFMAMVGRYVNILYRMDGNIKLYTLESVAMQFFSKLFYLAGAAFSATFRNLVLWELSGMALFSLAFLIPNRGRITFSPKILFSRANRQIIPYGLAMAPTAVMLWINSLFSKVYISKTIGNGPRGVFSMVSTLSNVVALVQAGFATFWSAYIYANYKTRQETIKQVHDYLTFLISRFLCLILGFEDLIFMFLGPEYRSGIAVFPIMLLVPVYSIISETTVYGISIAKKPIFDTLGIALSVGANIALCLALAPRYGLYGVCIALAGANIAMFLFRTVIAQKFYVTINSPARTSASLLFMLAVVGLRRILSKNFLAKLLVSLCGLLGFCLIYRTQLVTAVSFAKDLLRDLGEKYRGKKI